MDPPHFNQCILLPHQLRHLLFHINFLRLWLWDGSRTSSTPPLDTSKSDRTSGNWTTRGTFGTLLPCRSNCGVVIGLCGWVIDLREGWGRVLLLVN